MNQYPNICVIGSSGSGKSTSLRNLNPAETGFINVERKALPFKGAKLFTNEVEVTTIDEFFAAMKRFDDDTKIKQIVIDSFTALDEMVLAFCRLKYKGYDIYSVHNGMIRQIVDKTKLRSKFCIMIGIDEIVAVDQPQGGKVSKRVLKVEGRELQGTIEKEFTIVFFTDVIKSKSGSMEYKFLTNTDGINTAKSPLGMFAAQQIDNDLKLAIDTAQKYYE